MQSLYPLSVKKRISADIRISGLNGYRILDIRIIRRISGYYPLRVTWTNFIMPAGIMTKYFLFQTFMLHNLLKRKILIFRKIIFMERLSLKMEMTILPRHNPGRNYKFGLNQPAKMIGYPDKRLSDIQMDGCKLYNTHE